MAWLRQKVATPSVTASVTAAVTVAVTAAVTAAVAAAVTVAALGGLVAQAIGVGESLTLAAVLKVLATQTVAA